MAQPSNIVVPIPAEAGKDTVMDEPIAANTEPLEEDEFNMTEANWDAKSSSDSTSLSSSIYKHTYENGRRFHSYKFGRYPLPNDEDEQDRDNLKHAMMLELTDGKLFYAPIGDDPQKILDVGTGTGTWAIEMADQFPNSKVLGFDLSPIQPEWVPPNCKFMVDDCDEEWLNGDDWDLVHFRITIAVLKNVPKVLDSAFKSLKPGGWIEIQEVSAMVFCDDGTMLSDDPLIHMFNAARESLLKFGMDLWLPRNLRPALEAAGFVNIQCVAKKAPVGPWAQDPTLRVVGTYMRQALQDFITAMQSKALLAIMSPEEVDALCGAAKHSLKDWSRHRYEEFYFWTAQKPK